LTILFHDFHWGFALCGNTLLLELECLIHAHYQHYHRVQKWLVTTDSKQVDLLIHGHCYYYFQHYHKVQNHLWWLTPNRLIFDKKTLIMNVRIVSCIAGILNPLIWKNMFIEDNIPRHKNFSWLNIQPNISFCPPFKINKNRFRCHWIKFSSIYWQSAYIA